VSQDKSVKVEVPATSANLGAGFDFLGIALDITNTIYFHEVSEPGIHVEIKGEGSDSLPKDPTNLTVYSFMAYYKKVGLPLPEGVAIVQENRIPLSGGLGSSATAVLGGLLGARTLSGQYLTDEQLLDIACELEGHPDNIAPAFYGGLVVSMIGQEDKVTALKVATSPDWQPDLVIAVPEYELNTRTARNILNQQVSLDDAVHNLSRAALFVAAATTGRTDLLHQALEDRLHQEARSRLIPGMKDVFQSAMANGALGVCLSGSGPSILAFSQPDQTQTIGQAMIEAFNGAGLKASIIHTKPRLKGAYAVIGRDCGIF
jgi:homoserine kinase